MTPSTRHLLGRLLPALLAAAAGMSVAMPGLAQFKVIGADGKVTYTDREPSASEGRVVPLGARAAASAPVESDLPFELRQSVSKYPVTLYVTSTACEPCTAARQLLKQRGIPFSERMVVTAEDSEALEKLSGAREAPTLTIGSQTLRGLSGDVWNSYLDAAGYPRDSRLPATYQYRAATPIVERAATSTVRTDTRAAASVAPAAPAAATAQPPGTGGIRF